MHRSPRRPIAMLAIAAAALTSVAAAQSSAPDTRPAADLPAAEQILADSVKARGGAEKLKAVKSEHLTGTFGMAGMGEGALNIRRRSPNLMKITIALPQMGEVEQAYDGTHGWIVQMGQPMVLSGEQLEQMKDQAIFDREVDYKKHFKSMKTLEKTEFDGRMCYAVETVSQAGTNETRYYDVKTGLPAGVITAMQSDFGEMKNTTYLRDYKEVEGVMYAMTMEVAGPMGAQMLKINEVKLNTLEKDDFAMPDVVKNVIDGGN